MDEVNFCGRRTKGDQKKHRCLQIAGGGVFIVFVARALSHLRWSLYHYCTKTVWSLMEFHRTSYTLKSRRSFIHRPLWGLIGFHRVMKSRHRLSIPNFIKEVLLVFFWQIIIPSPAQKRKSGTQERKNPPMGDFWFILHSPTGKSPSAVSSFFFPFEKGMPFARWGPAYPQ